MGDSPSYYYLAESAHAAQIFPRRPRSRPRPRLGVWARLRGRGRFGCGCAASCKEVPPDAFETQWVNDEARWSGLKFTSDERGRGAHGLTSRVALQLSAEGSVLGIDTYSAGPKPNERGVGRGGHLPCEVSRCAMTSNAWRAHRSFSAC